jgi:hypothetical protein
VTLEFKFFFNYLLILMGLPIYIFTGRQLLPLAALQFLLWLSRLYSLLSGKSESVFRLFFFSCWLNLLPFLVFGVGGVAANVIGVRLVSPLPHPSGKRAN